MRIIKIIICVATMAFATASAFAARPAVPRPKPPPPLVHILVLGDSLIQGYGLPPGQDFPTQLGRALDARHSTTRR